MASRVLLLMPTTSYKAGEFVEAANRLGAEVVVGTERRQALADQAPGSTLALEFEPVEAGVRAIADAHRRSSFSAVVGTDDETVVLAAAAAARLGLRHNPPEAVRAARNKLEMRRSLRSAAMRCPDFTSFSATESAAGVAGRVRYPCVLKPLELAASRGVMRADGPAEFVRAFDRVAAIASGAARRGASSPELLVEDYLPGLEVAVEGLLVDRRLRLLALFDKPDPLTGPIFEETLFVTPSRLAGDVLARIEAEVAAGCRALGLTEGPIHAELRVQGGLPWILEIAPRTIGGLCSRTLRFGAGISLEELVLRHALGLGAGEWERERRAAGVMMVPIPRRGILRGVRGLRGARAVPLIEGVTITLHRGAEVVPLPEGHAYLGFIFARGERPAEVEAALREAHAHLAFDITPR